MQYYTSIHSLDIYFEVILGPSVLSLLTFHGKIRLNVLTLILILYLVDVDSSNDVLVALGRFRDSVE